MAHERSPILAERHQAAVRDPPPDPADTHVSVGPRTRACPSDDRPRTPPSKVTRAALAATPVARGQGCLGLQVSSISRAAIPASRTRGPSAHQIGPSPSHTRIGVQVKLVPREIVDVRAALVGAPAPSPAYAKTARAVTPQLRPSLDAIALIASARNTVAAAARPDANLGTGTRTRAVQIVTGGPAPRLFGARR